MQYMCKLYIAFDRQERYNIAILGEDESTKCRPGKGGNAMPASKAQQRAVSKYMKENYDVYQVRMPKGRKAEIKAHAEARGESLNGFINRAVDETMERDGGKADG